MTTEDIIIQIFCTVDDQMREVAKVPQARLYPSEIVTSGILFALKGGCFRAFYRWLVRDYDGLFGGLPHRTALSRQLKAHQHYADRLLVEPGLLAVTDSYPIELLFPIREGRSKRQIGRKKRDKGRWSIGLKGCWIVNTYGHVIGWKWLTMNCPDQDFHPLFTLLRDTCVVCAKGIPDNLKLCLKGTWNERMMIETIWSMLTVVCHAKKLFHRVAAYLEAHLGTITKERMRRYSGKGTTISRRTEGNARAELGSDEAVIE